jgi:hypothetical protein
VSITAVQCKVAEVIVDWMFNLWCAPPQSSVRKLPLVRNLRLSKHQLAMESTKCETRLCVSLLG